jgi:hypothetical protein
VNVALRIGGAGEIWTSWVSAFHASRRAGARSLCIEPTFISVARPTGIANATVVIDLSKTQRIADGSRNHPI